MADQSVRRRIGQAVNKQGSITGISTDVDLILLIDGTGSMQNLLDEVKARALSLRDDIVAGLAEKNRKVSKMRVKVIVFRDVYVDTNAFVASEWFFLPEDAGDFRAFVEGIRAEGGGDEPESGMEALRMAMQEFGSMQGKGRQIIVMMTDASAHRLDDPQRAGDPAYPDWMSDCRNVEELQNAWEGLNVHYRRLVIMAPQAYPWTTIQTWAPVQYQASRARQGIDREGFEAVIKLISGSIA